MPTEGQIGELTYRAIKLDDASKANNDSLALIWTLVACDMELPAAVILIVRYEGNPGKRLEDPAISDYRRIRQLSEAPVRHLAITYHYERLLWVRSGHARWPF